MWHCHHKYRVTFRTGPWSVIMLMSRGYPVHNASIEQLICWRCLVVPISEREIRRPACLSLCVEVFSCCLRFHCPPPLFSSVTSEPCHPSWQLSSFVTALSCFLSLSLLSVFPKSSLTQLLKQPSVLNDSMNWQVKPWVVEKHLKK